MIYKVGMHIHVIPNRDSPPTVLLRESYRDGKTAKKRTLANLSALPADQIGSASTLIWKSLTRRLGTRSTRHVWPRKPPSMAST